MEKKNFKAVKAFMVESNKTIQDLNVQPGNSKIPSKKQELIQRYELTKERLQMESSRKKDNEEAVRDGEEENAVPDAEVDGAAATAEVPYVSAAAADVATASEVGHVTAAAAEVAHDRNATEVR
jgi:hypothetical protein